MSQGHVTLHSCSRRVGELSVSEKLSGTRAAAGQLTQHCPIDLRLSSAESPGDTAIPHAGESCDNLPFLNADEEQQFPLLHKVQFSRIDGSVISQPTSLGYS